MRLSTFDYIAENRCPQIATFDPNPGLHQLPKVLIIEDLSIRISQRGILERGEKIHVTNAIDYEESLRTLQERNFQYVILDIRFSEKAEKKRNAPFGLIVRALLKLAGYPDDRIIITSDDKKICKMIMQNSDHPMGNKLEGAKHVLDQIRATLGNNAPQAPSPDLRSSPAPAA